MEQLAAARRPDDDGPSIATRYESDDELVNLMLARGLADNVPTEAALAHRGPTLVAPAMNPRMWLHPAVQENARLLGERGVGLLRRERLTRRVDASSEVPQALPSPPSGDRDLAPHHQELQHLRDVAVVRPPGRRPGHDAGVRDLA